MTLPKPNSRYFWFVYFLCVAGLFAGRVLDGLLGLVLLVIGAIFLLRLEGPRG